MSDILPSVCIMGRDISFVVILKTPQHDKTKLCFNVNEELSEDDLDCFMCVHFPDSRCMYSAKQDNRDKLCSVCSWFMQPMIDKNTEPMILDELSFTYYYTSESPIYSSCNIFHLLPLYEADDSYVQSTHSRVYNITKDNIDRLESNIKQCVDVENEGDTEAFCDSKCVLEFLKTWQNKDDVKLLCFM